MYQEGTGSQFIQPVLDRTHVISECSEFPKFPMYYIGRFANSSWTSSPWIFLKFQMKSLWNLVFLNAFPDLHEKFYRFQQAPFQDLKFQIWKLKFLWNLVSFFKILHFKPLIYINFESSIKVLTSLILYQNFCSPKNIRMFLRTVCEPSKFGRALNQ